MVGKNTGSVQTVMSSDPRLGQKPELTPKPRLAQNSELSSQQESGHLSEPVAQTETGLTSGGIVQPGLIVEPAIASPQLPPKTDSETAPRVVPPKFSLTGLHKTV